MPSDYDRVAKAMAYIGIHLAGQPTLEEVAAHVNLSPFHFQRLFCKWAGISPKRFQQSLILERGKALLDESRSVLEASDILGLSSGSRLHDHFVQLDAVTPGEYKRRGKDLTIRYGTHPTPFGPMFLAATERGICRAAFTEPDAEGRELDNLRSAWPLAQVTADTQDTQKLVRAMFSGPPRDKSPLSLYVTGTNFQVAVWRALLHIPAGSMASYTQVARAVGRPQSTRAVANAIGANPVAFLVPCHRVIRQSGALGGYRWDPVRKHAIQVWEKMRCVE